MKKTKIILPALGLLVLSTAASVTGTVAWFSANATVTASGMQVKAKADKGILINEVATSSDANWDDAAIAGQASPIQIRPTSTANTKVWYTASSKSSSSAAGATAGAVSGNLSGGAYTTLSATASSIASASGGVSAETNVYYVDADNDSTYDDGEGYYVKYTYYVKSSAEAIDCALTAGANNFSIKSVTATAPQTPGSANLNKALRVAVAVNGKAYIFAPITTTTTTYYVAASNTATTVLSGQQATSLAQVPAKTANGTPVDVYVYFEGEDANCMTDNVTATLDGLEVSVQFGLVTNDGAATDNGVAIPA